MKLGVSTYSYWHFKPERVPIEHVIEEAARLELDGIEISTSTDGLGSESISSETETARFHSWTRSLRAFHPSRLRLARRVNDATKKHQSHHPLHPVSTRTRYPLDPSQLRTVGNCSVFQRIDENRRTGTDTPRAHGR